jgi:hypothetical protein
MHTIYILARPVKLTVGWPHTHRLHNAAGINTTEMQRQQCWHMRRKEYMCNADATCCLHTRIQWGVAMYTIKRWSCGSLAEHRDTSGPVRLLC